jgi:hypothetical protein
LQAAALLDYRYSSAQLGLSASIGFAPVRRSSRLEGAICVKGVLRLKPCDHRWLILALALSHAVLAHADAQSEAQRALVQRQQQSDEFALRLRQSQQLLNPGSAAQRQKLEGMNLEQQQRLQNLNEQQILQLQSSEQSAGPAAEGQPARSAYPEQRLDRERQQQLQNFERQRQERD